MTRHPNPEVDRYLARLERWQAEFRQLRAILLGCDLAEEVKWGHPCYTHRQRNIVLFHGFKDYCALLFFKGALLDDRHGVLVRQTENVQAARQLRFTDARDIAASADTVIRPYVEQAIEVESSGLKVPFKATAEIEVPAELQARFDAVPGLKAAFDGLTPGRQRAYLLHFSGAKQSRTRASRVEKSIPQILLGKGLDD